MPLPSFYLSQEQGRSRSVPRAAAYGGGLGALAAVLKTFGLLHGAGSAAMHVAQIAGAAAAFALLCAGAAALRNFVARRLIWPPMR